MSETDPTELPSGFDPDRDVVLDARSLRGIAHPLRTKLLGLLRREGPSTATRLAQQLDLSSGITSYHLRQLAAFGFIVEDEARGSGRERWWRAAHRATIFDRSRLAPPEGEQPEVEALADEYLQSVAEVYAQKVHEWLRLAHVLPEEWRDAGTLSDTPLRITPEETERLQREIDEVVERFRRDDSPEATEAPASARRVDVQWQVFPSIRSRDGETSGGGRSGQSGGS